MEDPGLPVVSVVGETDQGTPSEPINPETLIPQVPTIATNDDEDMISEHITPNATQD